MLKNKRDTGLIAFIKKQCANWDEHYGHCMLNSEKCLVQQAKPCSYFERVLLPIAKHLGVYKRVVSQYQAIRKIKKDTVRLCECGAELLPRRRYCDKCRREKRKKTYREGRQKYYRKQRDSLSTVNENGVLQVA